MASTAALTRNPVATGAAAIHDTAGAESARSDASHALEEYLERFFARSISRAGAHGAEYRRLWSAARDAAADGKRIRPRLVLAAHHAYAGERTPDAVALAAAFEVLHTAFLIHDDVIDNDLVRRGAPNVAGRFALDAALRGLDRDRAADYGRASAILAGDLLIAAAHSIVARLDAPSAVRVRVLDVVDECVFAAAAGEHADVRYAAGVTPDEERILAMIEAKTACYSFSAPLRAGAVLGGADAATTARLGEIGRRMGIAFQLRDDLLGVFGDERTTGKSALGDLREGKETLLVAYARDHASWVQASPAFGRSDLDDTTAAPLRAAIVASGAKRRVEAMIQTQTRLALDGIADGGLPPSLAVELTRLLHAGLGRAR